MFIFGTTEARIKKNKRLQRRRDFERRANESVMHNAWAHASRSYYPSRYEHVSPGLSAMAWIWPNAVAFTPHVKLVTMLRLWMRRTLRRLQREAEIRFINFDWRNYNIQVRRHMADSWDLLLATDAPGETIHETPIYRNNARHLYSLAGWTPSRAESSE